ncbi:hypothetical protein NPIL_232521 [Nephila pilipes]|uniref:Uncharacterized protein n=1 Tax=Nephila pilipes TaxID=299642 RepID=A0A8X6MRS1_NEPPI|nr:hypothetical protein NPIL_232521 [Nephila pilipes]
MAYSSSNTILSSTDLFIVPLNSFYHHSFCLISFCLSVQKLPTSRHSSIYFTHSTCSSTKLHHSIYHSSTELMVWPPFPGLTVSSSSIYLLLSVRFHLLHYWLI